MMDHLGFPTLPMFELPMSAFMEAEEGEEQEDWQASLVAWLRGAGLNVDTHHLVMKPASGRAGVGVHIVRGLINIGETAVRLFAAVSFHFAGCHGQLTHQGPRAAVLPLFSRCPTKRFLWPTSSSPVPCGSGRANPCLMPPSDWVVGLLHFVSMFCCACCPDTLRLASSSELPAGRGRLPCSGALPDTQSLY